MSDKSMSMSRYVESVTDAMASLLVEVMRQSIEKAGVSRVNGARLSVPPRLVAAKPSRNAKAASTGKRFGPAKGSKATPRPCPVTGVLNTYRRFSYLMPEVRTAANLKKYKGWAKKSASAVAEAIPVGSGS